MDAEFGNDGGELMRTVKFVRLRIKNFILFPDETITFRPGLTLILGENLDEFDSNGAGKTVLKESISWTLFGETTSGETKVSMKGVKTQNCFELTIDGEPVTVTRTQSGGTTTLQIVTAAGDITKDSTTTISQAKLEQMLGMNAQVFRSVICFGGADHRGFASMTDKERKELFNQILHLDVWEEYAKKTHSRLVQVRGIQARLLAKQEELNTKGNSLDSYLEGLLARRAALGDRPVPPAKSALTDSLVGDIAAMLKEIENLRFRAQEADLKVKAAVEIRNEIKLHQGVVTASSHNEADLMRRLDQAAADLRDAKTGICPTCKQTVRNQDLMDKFLSQQKSLNSQLQAVRTKIAESQERISLLQSGDTGVDTNLPAMLRREIAEKEHAVNEARLSLDNLTSTMLRFELERSQYDAAAAEIEKSISEVVEARAEVVRERQECDLSLITYHKYILVAEEAEKMFGRAGIQNKIVVEIEAPFNGILRGFMRAFGYKGATVDMVPKKKLASGEERDKIDIKITDRSGGKRSFSSFSGGERRRIDLVFFLSLNHLFSTHVQVNFLALDEVLNNMDKEGLDCMRSVLVDECPDKAVWVLAPTDSIEWAFDNRLQVRKENGVSKVVQNA